MKITSELLTFILLSEYLSDCKKMSDSDPTAAADAAIQLDVDYRMDKRTDWPSQPIVSVNAKA